MKIISFTRDVSLALTLSCIFSLFASLLEGVVVACASLLVFYLHYICMNICVSSESLMHTNVETRRELNLVQQEATQSSNLWLITNPTLKM